MANSSISVALVLDYSGSITDVQDNVDDMQESAAYFVDQLGAIDEAEIIKFADDWDVVQSWQPGSVEGINILQAAIIAPYDNGRNTDLYNAVAKAVEDTAASSAVHSTQRRAVIVITDGDDTNHSTSRLDNVILTANTQGVPVFAVGLGQDLTTETIAILTRMADETGGHFYESKTSDNLKTIYQQLSDVLFEDSYILTYLSDLGAIWDENTKEFTSCSP